MTNLDRFTEIFSRHLTECVLTMPDKYCYPVEQVPVVVQRMKAAFQQNTFCHNSPAIKRTCRELGIKATRTTINQFLKGEINATIPAIAGC